MIPPSGPEQRIDDPAADFLPPLIDELTGAYGALLLMPFVVLMLYRYPLQRGTLLVRIPLHLSILVVYPVLHTLWNAATREVAYGLAGREYDYGSMRRNPLRPAPVQGPLTAD